MRGGARIRLSKPTQIRPDLEFGPLTHMLGVELRKAQIHAEKAFTTSVSRHLLPGHLTILVLLKNNPNRSQSAIAHAAGIDRSSLVPILRHFEQQGWIVRKKSFDDGRVKTTTLTRKGALVIERHLPRTQELEQFVKSGMGEKNYSQLIRLLIRFQSTLS